MKVSATAGTIGTQARDGSIPCHAGLSESQVQNNPQILQKLLPEDGYGLDQ